MITKESSFSGFLDGYQSRNIATIEHKFHYKLTDIADTARLLVKEMSELPVKDELLINGFEKVCRFNRDGNYVTLMEQLYKLGEFLKLNMDALDKFKQAHLVIFAKIRIIVINFLELARISEDSRLINLAIDVGSKFGY